ncbi:MAG: pyridoxamine 5'-phosphate oxidase family protein [Anaerolineae bacterium]|nr:pyridoxamine 5'-phosphate oxidase family protein [Anaerolineae bacterium]
MTNTLRARIHAFLARHTTLTLATTGPEGPQAAALFYAHDAALSLYFLSEPSSRHARNLAADPRCAVTIQADGQDWRVITGLQMEGRAQVVSTPEEWQVAYETFRAKFPFVGEAWRGEGSAALTLSGPLARSRFYRIAPHWMRLIDNTLGFGHKDELRL